ncbi:MAG: hypothetical protein M1830_008421 [Pleopsidium flavum]|nr:MAG: hypothetical protein M1830_008421 [Pleopsidium flavum]
MELQSSIKLSPGPPSPTLTNPDMILPYTVYPLNPKPSPANRPSPPSEAIGERLNSQLPNQVSEKAISNARSVTPGNTPPLGSYGSGTMLPDIEEVDTTPKGGRSRRTSSGSRTPPLVWPPRLATTQRGGSIHVEPYLKRLSHGSSSVGSEDFDFGHWGGFDGAASVDGESVFQDEEEDNSLAAAHAGYGTVQLSNGIQRKDTVLEGDHEDPFSHAALSKRAERILANAKKRLTNMEGNLSRARHSLAVTPSSSMSSISSKNPDATERSPPLSSKINGWGISPTKHRQLHSPLSPSASSPGHSRVFSETSVPSSLHTSPQSLRLESDEIRASSAMGSVGMTPSLRDQDAPKSLNTMGRGHGDGLLRSASLSNRHNATLQPLDEEEPSPASLLPADTILAIPRQDLGQDAPIVAVFGSQFSTKPPLTRSRSSIQMRDLREQMQDLKGKISTLKERARKDNLRRRSLQSLKTPNPFTAAEHWDSAAGAYQNGSLTADTGNGLDDLHSAMEQFKADEERRSREGDGSMRSIERDEAVAGMKQGTRYEDWTGQSQYEDAEETTGKEDKKPFNDEDAFPEDEPHMFHHNSIGAGPETEEDSIAGDQEFYESSPSPMGERHEDRKDAFDYEHFFLHSGMGNYSRTELGRRNSSDSTDSAATTKGPTILTDASSEKMTDAQSQKASRMKEIDYARQKGHQRNTSVDSVSTFATFATATEGRGSDQGSDEDEEEWKQYQHQYPMAGTWHQDYFTRHNAAAIDPEQSVPEIWSNGSHTPTRLDSAVRINGRLTPSSPTRSSTPSTTRSFPLVNKSKHLNPSPSPRPSSVLVSVLLGPAQSEDGTTTPALQLSKDDRALVEKLVESLGKVCIHLHTDGGGGGKYEGRVWRRRLDAARRVLNGEVDEDVLQ